MSGSDVLLQDVRDSNTYDEWQRQLLDCFYEEEEKDELIRSLRAHLDDRYGSLDPEELEALKKEVVSSLVSTAAQEAGGKEFVPAYSFNPRLHGIAKREGDAVSILVENRQPCHIANGIIVHELTYIWQFEKLN